MAGFFGESWEDPKTQMILAMASGLLGNRGNFGQGVSAGLMGGVGAFNDARKMQMLAEQQKAQNDLREAQAQRTRELAAKGIDPNVPSAIQIYEYIDKLPPEKRRDFYASQRTVPTKEINGVVHEYYGPAIGWVPQTTLQQEGEARQYLEAAKTYGGESQRAAFDLVTGWDPTSRRLTSVPRSSQVNPPVPMPPGASGGPRIPSASSGFPSGYMDPQDQQRSWSQFGNSRLPNDKLQPVPPTASAAQPGAPVTPPAAPRLEPPEQAKRDDERVKEVDATRQALADAERSLGVVDMLIKHPGRGTATGLSGTLDPRNYLPGTDARSFERVRNQVEGRAFLEAFEKLKGGGQITQIEGEKATAAIARLQRDQSDEAFLESMIDLKEVLSAAKLRAQQKLERLEAGVPTTNQGASPSGRSNIEDLVKKYGG